MTLICVSLAARDAKGVVKAARAARGAGADTVEVRLDRLRGLSAASVARLGRSIDFIPAIATLRPEWEGGAFAGSEDERIGLLAVAAESGFDFIDMELGMDRRRQNSLLGLCKERGVGTIVSHHDGVRTPGVTAVVRRIEKCASLGDIGKAAFFCASGHDAAAIMEAAGAARQKGLCFIAIGMGERGRLTRLLAPFIGSAMAYACLDRRHMTAEGQPEIGEIIRMWGGPVRRRRLSARTAIYALIGHPLGHSLSPIMHNAAFKRLGMDAIYMPFDVNEHDLEGTLLALGAAGLRGANVTIPYKEKIIAYLDGLDDGARRIGAVNTILNRGGRLRGFNTDVLGFIDALRGAGVRPRGARALVIGAGGAARAAVRGLLDERAIVTVANRSRGRALGLRRALGAPLMKVVSQKDIRAMVVGFDIVVNCTPAGMRGFGSWSPVPARLLHRGITVLDMVYNPVRTPLLAAAEKAGARTVSGMEMFIRQGMESLRIWTQRTVPLAAIRRALAGSQNR
jgi:3-dehydroquinate dehydratase/shikimate dehydrogenase